MTNPHQKQITSFQIKHQIWLAKSMRKIDITAKQAKEEIIQRLGGVK